MLTVVEAENDQGALLTMALSDVSDGIILKEVDGLGPVKATLVSSSFAGIDGEQYHSARREPRDIKLKFGMEPMYGGTSVREIRKRLYKHFMTKRNVNLRFYMEDGLVVNISGKVESNDPPMFTREPEMEVVVRCFKPDFVDPTPVTVSSTSTSATGVLTELVEYDGTAETGIVLTVNVDRTLSEFTFYHQGPDGVLSSMDFAASLLAGDVLTISTVSGNKYATLIRGGTSIPIVYGISPYSKWTELLEGDNYIRLYTDGVSGVPYSIEYTNRYGGL